MVRSRLDPHDCPIAASTQAPQAFPGVQPAESARDVFRNTVVALRSLGVSDALVGEEGDAVIDGPAGDEVVLNQRAQ